MELKVNPEIEKAIVKMFPEFYEALKDSIKRRGLLVPIEVMPDGTVVDGHHRLRICKELGIEPRIKVLEHIKTVEEAKRYTTIVNAVRRHLTDFQRAKMALVLYEEEKKKAKEREALSGKLKEKVASIEATFGKAAEIVAQQFGLSRTQFERCLTIMQKAPQEIQDLVEDEKIAIYSAYTLVQLLENEDYPVPEEKKKEFYNRIIEADEKDRLKELDTVYKIVAKTNQAKSLLEVADEEIAKKIEKDYKDKFYTEEIDPERVKHDIIVAEGNLPKLKRVYVPWEKFANEEDPELAAALYFKKFSGRFLKKAVVEMAVGEVDPYEWEDREEED